LEHLLFATYLIFFAWLITKIKFFKTSGLTNSQLVILYLLKVMAGIFYGWIGVYYGNMAQMIDTWAYHYESLEQYQLLKKDPWEFAASLFRTSYEGGYTHFLTTHQSWWNDVKGNFLIKIMAIFNLFSFGNYYVNVIFMAFITMFGPVAIYRVMQDVFPTKKLPVLFATFLVPSFLYWTSGMHKEGIIFTAIAMIVYHFYFGLKEKRFPFYRIAVIAFGFLLILILRNFLIFTIIPPLFAWWLCGRFKLQPLLTFISVFVFAVLVFFTAKYIDPAFDFPQATVIKQQEFLKLSGGSTVAVRELDPKVKSFARNAPQSLSLTVLRPYPADVHHLLSLVAAVEINFLLLLFIVFLVWRRNGIAMNPFILFCTFLSFGVLMMIGYTVNNLGAIVRYRSIVLPFLIVPIAAKIDWNRIGQLISGNIKNNNNI
jgi:hypothetical protein